MKNGFWGLIWSTFLEIQGWLLGFIGIGVTILLVRFPFKTPIPLDFVIVISLFVLLFIATLLKAIQKLWEQNKQLESEVEQLKEENKNPIFPKILVVQKDQQTGVIRLLLESSKIFVNNMYISLDYTDDNGFEISIGLGFIRNIQSDGKILAVLDQPFAVYQDIIDRLANNEKKILEKTVVKPGTVIPSNQPNQP